ncbi:hypothetical protein GGG16DRAFT_113334 [Schizophyllum commune]
MAPAQNAHPLSVFAADLPFIFNAQTPSQGLAASSCPTAVAAERGGLTREESSWPSPVNVSLEPHPAVFAATDTAFAGKLPYPHQSLGPFAGGADLLGGIDDGGTDVGVVALPGGQDNLLGWNIFGASQKGGQNGYAPAVADGPPLGPPALSARADAVPASLVAEAVAAAASPPTFTPRKTVSTQPRRKATSKRRLKLKGPLLQCSWAECGGTFTRLTNLKGESSPSSFAYAYNTMLEHEKLHLNQMEYACDVPFCDKRFNTRGGLRSHLSHKHKGEYSGVGTRRSRTK